MIERDDEADHTSDSASDPTTGRAGGPADPDSPSSSDPDVAALDAELGAEDGQRAARLLDRLGRAIRLAAGAVAGLGVVAMVVGAAAWRRWPAVVVVVVIACLPALIAPLYVAVRARALARAASHPRELLDQARDLAGRVRDSKELRALGGQLRTVSGGRQGGSGPTSSRRRSGGWLRSGWRLARLATTVIGQAQPDDHRHHLLAAFTPERLRRTWLAATISVLATPVATLVLLVSVPVLILTLVF